MTDHIDDAQRAVRQMVAANLKSLRKKQGLSQEAFGERAGMHRTQIGFIERGTANLTLDNLTLIAVTLGVRVTDLFNESPEAVPALKLGRRRKSALSLPTDEPLK